MSNLSYDHWKALTRVLRYLKHTLTFILHFTKYHKVLEEYCDVNLISDMKDSKSTRVYVFTIGEVALSWKSSKKWTFIALSMIESGFIVLDKAGEEA